MKLPKTLLRRAIVAFRYKAGSEAGMSQEPELFSREETQDWADAKALTALLRETGHAEVILDEDETEPPKED